MSFSDDTCDFCGRYIDGMGNDVKSGLTVAGEAEQKYWCGFCVQGMDAQWSHYSIEKLDELAARHQARYDADPIDHDWSQPENQNLTDAERFRKRVRQCTYMDLAWQLQQYASHRKAREV